MQPLVQGALRERGERHGPYMEGPDGRGKALQKIERYSSLERGLGGDKLQRRKMSINREWEGRRLIRIYTPINKGSRKFLWLVVPFLGCRSSVLFINYLRLSFTPKTTIPTISPTRRNINTAVPRIFTRPLTWIRIVLSSGSTRRWAPIILVLKVIS